MYANYCVEEKAYQERKRMTVNLETGKVPRQEFGKIDCSSPLTPMSCAVAQSDLHAMPLSLARARILQGSAAAIRPTSIPTTKHILAVRQSPGLQAEHASLPKSYKGTAERLLLNGFLH